MCVWGGGGEGWDGVCVNGGRGGEQSSLPLSFGLSSSFSLTPGEEKKKGLKSFN